MLDENQVSAGTIGDAASKCDRGEYVKPRGIGIRTWPQRFAHNIDRDKRRDVDRHLGILQKLAAGVPARDFSLQVRSRQPAALTDPTNGSSISPDGLIG